MYVHGNLGASVTKCQLKCVNAIDGGVCTHVHEGRVQREGPCANLADCLSWNRGHGLYGLYGLGTHAELQLIAREFAPQNNMILKC
jgi:hypothetical protein